MAKRLPASPPGRSCYFSNFKDKEQAIHALNTFARKDGYYLVRDSTSVDNSYTLSVTHHGSIVHKRISNQDNNYSFLGSASFPSLDSLLSHYHSHDIPNVKNIKHLRLLSPVTELENGITGEALPTSSGHFESYGGSPRRVAPAPPGAGYVHDDEKELYPIMTSAGTLSPEVLSQRTPAPLPEDAKELPAYDSHYYYSIADEEFDRLPMLRKLLELDEELRKRCTCGLLVIDSRLPRGWEVHRSEEPRTKGRIFFVSPDERSHWKLPDKIYKLLNKKQRKFVSDILRTTSGDGCSKD